MPLFAAELADWWLGEGQEFLPDLLQKDPSQPRPSEVGFAQAVQRKLRAFDNDQTIHDALEIYLRRIESCGQAQYDGSAADLLQSAISKIFTPLSQRALADDAGDSNDLLGLGYLDAAELHRIRIIQDGRAALDDRHAGFRQAKILDELHESANTNYRSLYLGFRVHVSCSLLSILWTLSHFPWADSPQLHSHSSRGQERIIQNHRSIERPFPSLRTCFKA